MNAQLAKALRSLQVYFPQLQDFRFEVQRNMRGWMNQTHETDFNYLSRIRRSSNNLFVDIGANRGDAIHSIQLRRPDAKIVAFEPNPFLTRKLERLCRRDRHVQIHNVGLGSESGGFELYIPFYNNYMFDGLASFKEENARNWLVNRIYGFRKSKLKIRKVTCQVRRLDEFGLNPHFIKIDVQGFEYEVLKGARETLQRSRPILLIETPGPKELQFLLALGYAPHVFRKGILIPGAAGSLNVFFFPENMSLAG